MPEIAELKRGAGMKALAAKEKDPHVYINADNDATHGRVLEVLAAVRNSGIEKVTFSIKKNVAAPVGGAVPVTGGAPGPIVPAAGGAPAPVAVPGAVAPVNVPAQTAPAPAAPVVPAPAAPVPPKTP